MNNTILLMMLREYCYLLCGFNIKFYWCLKGYLLSSTTVSHYLYISLCYLHTVVFCVLLVWFYGRLWKKWRNKILKSNRIYIIRLADGCDANQSKPKLVVVNFDALAQASDFRIERRQVAFPAECRNRSREVSGTNSPAVLPTNQNPCYIIGVSL